MFTRRSEKVKKQVKGADQTCADSMDHCLRESDKRTIEEEKMDVFPTKNLVNMARASLSARNATVTNLDSTRCELEL